MSRRRGARGFTLVSVLLAVLMLTIGLVALARAQALLTSAESTVSSRSVALALASTYVEQLRGRDPWTLVPEAPVVVDGEGVPAAAGPYRRSTVITLDQTNLVRVRVLVTYPRGPVPIELTTLIYRPPA
jgi:type II secretory pathway pseudopilin PulG